MSVRVKIATSEHGDSRMWWISYSQPGYRQVTLNNMFIGIIYLIGGIIEVLVGLRFIFELLGANPSSSFVSTVYSWSSPLVTPFAGIFGKNATATGSAGAVVSSVLDWTALVALVVYGLVLGVLSALLRRY